MKRSRCDRYRPYKKPDWTGISMISRRVGCQHDRYVHQGYRYCTLGEFRVALMLTAMGIPYTPDVNFPIQKEGTGRGYAFRPDFVFNGRSYVWTEEDGTEIVIQGIECKSTNKKPQKALLLYEQRGIHILVMNDAEIRRCWNEGQGLPLRPYSQ